MMSHMYIKKGYLTTHICIDTALDNTLDGCIEGLSSAPPSTTVTFGTCAAWPTTAMSAEDLQDPFVTQT